VSEHVAEIDECVSRWIAWREIDLCSTHCLIELCKIRNEAECDSRSRLGNALAASYGCSSRNVDVFSSSGIRNLNGDVEVAFVPNIETTGVHKEGSRNGQKNFK
jgi:hypothetical protein